MGKHVCKDVQNEPDVQLVDGPQAPDVPAEGAPGDLGRLRRSVLVLLLLLHCFILLVFLTLKPELPGVPVLHHLIYSPVGGNLCCIGSVARAEAHSFFLFIVGRVCLLHHEQHRRGLTLGAVFSSDRLWSLDFHDVLQRQQHLRLLLVRRGSQEGVQLRRQHPVKIKCRKFKSIKISTAKTKIVRSETLTFSRDSLT